MFIAHKQCKKCHSVFYKRQRDSFKQWYMRKYCSLSCISKSKVIKPLLDRFMEKIEIITESGCWIWTGATDGHGYGHLATTYKKSPIKAYRVSYELFVGKIPDGLLIRHKCDVPSCVNPSHLECGTQKDNMMDASRRKRLNPVSRLNLRPGEKGKHGAGSKSNKEL